MISERIRFEVVAMVIALVLVIIAASLLMISTQHPVLTVFRWIVAASCGISGIFLGLATLARWE